MSGTQIQAERIRRLNDEAESQGQYVLYWMQQSQRAEFNHALEFGAGEANRRRLPLVVAFGLADDYPEANLRHYQFMLEGLVEAARTLTDRGIGFVLRRGSPPAVALELARDAAVLICDRGYTRVQKAWRKRVAEEAACTVIQIESDVIVPVDHVADRALYSAQSLRSRLRKCLSEFLTPLDVTPLEVPCADPPKGEPVTDAAALVKTLRLRRDIPPVSHFFRGGTPEARHRMTAALRGLSGYAAGRSRPEEDEVSHLSKYLHFGQISPVYVALKARAAAAPAVDRDSFLDELIVRRELAHNWVHFTPDYDRYAALPEWARKTLSAHAADHRDPCYSLEDLERARTHDRYWNAAMREMLYTGYMHNKMRMYWGKKVLEWSPSPEEAFERTLLLNNRYFLDGRDPNSFANVGWIFGLHDRPWQERPIYGTIRSMTAGGLERKSDIGAYVEKVDGLVANARTHGIRFPWDS